MCQVYIIMDRDYRMMTYRTNYIKVEESLSFVITHNAF